MKILVPVKRVVDYNVKVRAKSDERGPDLSNAKKTIKTLFGNESSLSFLKSKFSPNQKKLIVKDPFLVFASLYLSSNYKIVMCERPILPLAGSFKRMGWEFSEYDRLIKDFESIGIKDIAKIDNSSISSPVLGAVRFCQLYSICLLYTSPSPRDS